MYDIRPKASAKLDSYRLKKANHSLPKLIIEPDFSDNHIRYRNQSSMQKYYQSIHHRQDLIFRKQRPRPYDFLQIMRLRKSSIYESNRNAKHKNSTKSQQPLSSSQTYNPDDVEFCKQQLKQYSKEAFKAKQTTKVLKIRVRTQGQQTQPNKNNMVYSVKNSKNLEPQAKKLSILIANKNEYICNFQKRQAKVEEKLSRLYPQSYPFKLIKTGADSFSPWSSSYQDLLYTQP